MIFAISANVTCGDGPQIRAHSAVDHSTEWFSVQQDGNIAEPALEIRRGEQLVGVVHSNLMGTPAIYPLCSPSGLPLTRDFPMKKGTPHEKTDHDHHRSVWFTHGDVNGTDFWLDDDEQHIGRVIQRQADVTTRSDGITIVSQNDWVDHDGKGLLSDERTIRFHSLDGINVLDFGVKLVANTSAGDVVFGDTKEGTFGIRVAGTIKVDAKLGGHIENAQGKKDEATWSEASDWVDYSGPVISPTSDPKNPATWPRAGITILAHPANEVTPTRWHVRSYGLFAANPFGRHHFGQPAYKGVSIPAGQSLRLHYRVLLHDGDLDRAKTELHYAQYADQSPW